MANDAPEISAMTPAIETPLSREQVVDRIIQINKTATTAFLSRFEDQSLREYLRHLSMVNVPRGAQSAWVRPGDTPAIVGRESQD